MLPRVVKVAEAQTAVDTLQSYLQHTNHQLSSLATRIRNDFEVQFPPDAEHPNPLSIISRLRTLENNIPRIRERLMNIHNQKMQLAALCKKELALNAQLASTLLPVALPDQTTELSEQLESAQRNVSAVLAKTFQSQSAMSVGIAHSIPTTNDAVGELNMALLRAAANASLKERDPDAENTAPMEAKLKSVDDSPVLTKNSVTVKPSKSGKPPLKSSNPASKPDKGKKTKASSTSATSAADSLFKPIPKSTYNRLPRVLKVKAGKLPQINEFYEQVFNIMAAKGGKMTLAQLKKATGEADETRFEVLRGLTVLRKAEKAYQLTCMKT